MLNSKTKKIILSSLFALSLLTCFALYNYLNITEFSSKEITLFIILLFLIAFLFITALMDPRPDTGKKKTDRTEPDQKQPENIQITATSETMAEKLLMNINNATDQKQTGDILLKNFAAEFSIVQGIFYFRQNQSDEFDILSVYAIYRTELTQTVKEGDGMIGQVAINKRPEYIKDIAPGYITVVSGLGSASASNLLIMPFVSENKTIGIIEVAAFEDFPENYKEIWNKMNKTVADKLMAFQ